MPELPDLRKDPGLGPLLKELRGRLGLSHKHVAAAVWGDEGKWNWHSKLENRPNAYPSEADLDRILEVLGSSRVEAETLLGRRTWSDPVAGPMAAVSALAAAPAPEPMRSSPFTLPAAAPIAAAPPATTARDLALRGEGLRLLSEMDGEDLEQGVRQLRSLRARSRR